MIKKIAASLAIIATVAAPASAQEAVKPLVDVRNCIFITHDSRVIDLQAVTAMVYRSNNTLFYLSGNTTASGLTPDQYSQVLRHYLACKRLRGQSTTPEKK